MKKLGEIKGYKLIYVNKNGNNAFFIKKDLLNENFKEISVDEGFVKNSFNELINVKEKSIFEKQLKLSKLVEV